MPASDPARFYLEGEYERRNPDWDRADAGWKAAQVARLLTDHRVSPASVLEVGCGSGAVLLALHERWPAAAFEGWDIAPGAARLWPAQGPVRFHQGDFLQSPMSHHDLVLLLDVIEHVANPHDFLTRLRPRGELFVLHVPLDLSVASVWRETPLLGQRRGVGHIHYFTRNLALELLAECGFEVLEARFTGAHLRPRATLAGRAASLARRAVFALGRERGVRLLGGDTLLVMARPRDGAGAPPVSDPPTPMP